MGFFSAIFGSQEERNFRTCLKIYDKAKKARPGKDERDYLKIVLITKPPFDYQYDVILERILDDCDNSIEKLAELIYAFGNPKSPLGKDSWEARERNIKWNQNKFKERNQKFFSDFWGNQDNMSLP